MDSLLQSPSPRKAWIETLQRLSLMMKLACVAFPPEGVD